MAQTLAQTIADTVQQAIEKAVEAEKVTLGDIASKAGASAGDSIFHDVGSLSNLISAVVDVVALTQPELGLPLELLSKGESEAGKSGIGFGIGYIMGQVFGPAISPFILPLQHFAANIAQSEIFDPATAADLAARGIISQAYGESEAGGGNLDKAHFDSMLEAAMTRPDPGQLLNMLNLQLVDVATVDQALQHHGYPQAWHARIRALARQLLSSADLALAFLRGDIDQETMYGYADQLGVTRTDMDVLVGNTGEPLGLEQLLQAYRRQIIDQPTLERGIRQSRVRNEWIPTAEALRFAPMSTSDAARAVVEGYISSDEGQKIAEQNGLTPDHWPLIVESWGRPLSHEQMLTLYHRGLVSQDQVVQAIKESDLKNKYIDGAVALGRRLIPERTIVSMLNHGVVDGPTASRMLLEQGFTDADAQALIKLGTHEHNITQKELSKADIIALYADRLMTRTQASDQLVKLGYSADIAAWLLQLADAKAHASVIRSKQGQIRAGLHAHHLTAQQALGQLVALGVDRLQAQGLVDEWLAVRGTVTKSLTEAQIVKAAEDGVIDSQNAYQRLQGLGYSTGDAQILLLMKGIKVG